MSNEARGKGEKPNSHEAEGKGKSEKPNSHIDDL